MSRKIVREHGGDILLQSVPDVGSKFTIRLPMKSAFAGDATGTHPALPPEE